MQPVSLGAWRLENEDLATDALRLIGRQLGRHYDFDGQASRGQVEQLEEAFRELSDRPQSLAVSSATEGLAVALQVLGVDGGNVVLPAYAFAACAAAIRACGATPIVVPCDPVRLVPQASDILNAVNDQTQAVMAVHMRGIPVDVAAVRARLPAGIGLIEDCSQFDGMGHGMKIESGHSDVTVFSFQSRKIITGGEGGMMTFTDSALRDQAAQHSDSGWFLRPGLKDLPVPRRHVVGSRMPELVAAIVLPQLRGLQDFCAGMDSVRIELQDQLSGLARPLDLPDWTCGGVLAVSADNEMKSRLRKGGVPLFGECLAHQDPHRASGWPTHLGRWDTTSTAPLDDVALIQVLPNWTSHHQKRFAEIVDGRTPR